MRRFAVTALLLAESIGGEALVRVEIPGVRSTFEMDRAEFELIGRADNEAMSFEQALQFARNGRRIYRAGWGAAQDLGTLSIVDGHLRWQLSADMTVILPSEDLLASDWRVA